MKQNKWTKVAEKAKKSTKSAVNTDKIILTPNAFQMLDVEESSPCNDHSTKEANQTRRPSKDNPTRRRNLPKFED